MRQRFVLGLVIAAVAAVGVALLVGDREPAAVAEPPPADGSQPTVIPPAQGGVQTAAPDFDENNLPDGIAELEQALAAAIARRERAAEALARSERDVEELEAWIADIEARGEDPADYAEEGLELFQPAFYDYEDAFAALERAEREEALLRAALAEARASAN